MIVRPVLLPGLPVSALHGPAAASPPVRRDGARLRCRGDQHPVPPAAAPQRLYRRGERGTFSLNVPADERRTAVWPQTVWCLRCRRWKKLASRSTTQSSGRSWTWRRRTYVSQTTWSNTWRRTAMTSSWMGRAGRVETSGSEPSSPCTSTRYCPLHYKRVGPSPAQLMFYSFSVFLLECFQLVILLTSSLINSLICRI